jgi:peptidylprolyl isomerase
MQINSRSITFVLLTSLLWSGCQAAGAEEKEKKKKFVTKEESLSRPSNSPLGEGTITTPSGLKYKDVKVGGGAQPKWGEVVRVECKGFTMPGEVPFLGTKTQKIPMKVVLGPGNYIKAWDEAILSMKVGGIRLILVPPELGFGKKGSGSAVPPDTTLKYEIELKSIVPSGR